MSSERKSDGEAIRLRVSVASCVRCGGFFIAGTIVQCGTSVYVCEARRGTFFAEIDAEIDARRTS